MFMVIPRFVAEQVAQMVINGHLRKSRQGTTSLLCESGDGLSGKQAMHGRRASV